MHILGRIIKTILRSLFSIIIFLLLVGVSKMQRDVRAYISFLNTTDWSVFHWSQPSTWVDPFWPHSQNMSLDDLLSDGVVSTGVFGSNSIDSLFEKDLNTIVDDGLSGDEVEYGFTMEGQSTGIYKSTNTSSVSSSQLLKLIKQRELTK